MKKRIPKLAGIWLVAIFTAVLPGSLSAQKKTENLSEKEKIQVIEQTSDLLNELYVFPDVAKEIGVHLKAKLEEGAFDTVSDKEAFAGMMTREMQSVSHDKHMRIRMRPPPVVSTEEVDPVLDDILRKENQTSFNSGYIKVEILPGNIGYVDLRGFVEVESGKETASAAMKLISNTYAVIFDIRKNGGGDPAMVQYLCSYFFDKPTHLNSLYWREGDRTEEFWTHDDITGKKMADVPLFVLTARRTFSGAEEFAYNLQTRKRATLIGEVTGGGANPGGTRVVNDDFFLFIPTGRAINPVTGTNWEGVGVKPDMEVNADSALDLAIREATIAAENYYQGWQDRIVSGYQKSKQLFDKASLLYESDQREEADKLVNEGLQNGLEHYFLDEQGINAMGYQFLGEKKIQMAIAIFAFNVMTFPGSANTYDSLGEAYLANGDNQLALENYKKSIELDPSNSNARKIIDDLNKKK